MAESSVIAQVRGWKTQSENLRNQYEARWAQNLKLVNGIWSDDELARSKTRNRSKIFFRKIWAANWRLTASIYNAYLKDRYAFKIEPREPEDVFKAVVLQKMMEYRIDWMYRHDSLYTKFLWSIQNILTFGWCPGRLEWRFSEKYGVDNPHYTVYPNEQVYPDLSADTREDMRFIIFENFMTEEAMKELGYKNIDKATPSTVPSSQLRAIRYSSNQDPLQNPGANEYPKPGKYANNGTDNERYGAVYRVYEAFYRKNGQIWYCVTDLNDVEFVAPKVSPYGPDFPVIMGQCLLRSHQMIGEGFPEPQEGPQVSYNDIINRRKDNISLAMNKMKVVARYGNVDLQSLMNSRAGGVVLADDISAVQELQMADVTQSAYMEAAADASMMEEMSAVTPMLNGLGKNEKATVASINQTEGNAKIDLFLSIVGETFFRDFFCQLAELEARFETDDRVMRVANNSLRQQLNVPLDDVYDLGFDADYIVNVGMGSSKDADIQRINAFMQTAIMSNQSTIQGASTGLIPRDGVQLFSIPEIAKELLPKMGYKDNTRFFYKIKPDPRMIQGGSDSGGMRGGMEPQMGGDMMARTGISDGSMGMAA